jgi:hypothetical protein
LELRLATAPDDILDGPIPIKRDLLATEQCNSDIKRSTLPDRERGDYRYCK